MAIKKKINKATLSKSNDKKSQLLIKVDELMEKLDNDYGPLLLEELQKRLETTINEFHSDLKTILEQTFNEKTQDKKLFGLYTSEADPFFSVIARNNKSNN